MIVVRRTSARQGPITNSEAEAARGTESATERLVGGADVAWGSMPSSAISCAPLLFGSGGLRFLGMLDGAVVPEVVVVE